MSSSVIGIEATPLAAVGATLGEGPVWVERDRALWFVDIKAPRIYRLDPALGVLTGWEAPEQIGWVLPADDGRFLAGMGSGLYMFDPADGGFALHREIDHRRLGNRLNDCAVDPAGRVWFGSMDDGEAEPTGRLYSFDGATVRDSGIDPVVITNGPAVTPDGRTLYAVDTLERRVDAFTVDTVGRLSEQRPFLTLDPGLGWPDGAICDAEGGLWLGFFGGWAARRYAPDGTPTHEARFTTANVTKIAIGGPDGRTAYATTARKGLTDATLAGQPNAGDVFTFAVDVSGLPTRPVVLTP